MMGGGNSVAAAAKNSTGDSEAARRPGLNSNQAKTPTNAENVAKRNATGSSPTDRMDS